MSQQKRRLYASLHFSPSSPHASGAPLMTSETKQALMQTILQEIWHDVALIEGVEVEGLGLRRQQRLAADAAVQLCLELMEPPQSSPTMADEQRAPQQQHSAAAFPFPSFAVHHSSHPSSTATTSCGHVFKKGEGVYRCK